MKDKIIDIGKDSAWYLFANIATGLIGFIALPILTRLFVPREFGLFSLVNTAVMLASPIAWSWLANSIIRFYPEYKDKGRLDVFYSTTMRFGPFILGFLLLVVLPVAAFALPLGDYRLLICLGIVVFALYCEFNILLSVMRARRMVWQYSSFSVAVYFARYIVGAAFVAWLGMSVEGMFWAWLASMVLLIPIEFRVLGISDKIKRASYSKKLRGELVRYGFPLIFATFLSEVLSASDRYMLQGFKGAGQVGLYSMVYTLVTNLEGVIAVFIMLGATPIVIRTFDREGEGRAEELIGKLTRYFVMLLTPVLLGVWLLRYPVLRVLTSPKYLPSQSAVLPIAIGIFIFYISWLPMQPFYLKKNTKLILVPMFIAMTSNLILNGLMIPAFGFKGAAWATAISYIVYFIIGTTMGTRKMRWRVPWAGIAKIGVACLAMTGAILGMLALDIRGAAGLAADVAVGTVTYIGVLFLVRGFTSTELEFARSVASRVPMAGRLFRSKPGADEAGREDGEGPDEKTAE